MHDAHSAQDWRAWFAENGARLRLIARQWTRSEADADDVLQEAFVRFWKHQRHLPGNPNALVVTSIRRSALDLVRRSDRRALREKAVGDDMDTVSWFEPEADPRLAALAESLKLLPAEQREVVVSELHERFSGAAGRKPGRGGLKTKARSNRHRALLETDRWVRRGTTLRSRNGLSRAGCGT